MPHDGWMGPADGLGETAIQATERLDLAEFGRLLREHRGVLSIRQAAADAGVSFSTLSRVEAGAQPDLATFTRLCAWLRISPARFFTPVTERRRSPLEEAVTHLRTDPRLSPDARGKITSVLTDLYAALASEIPTPKAVLACHLRATSVMRPGVPPRMATLLTDLQNELVRQVEAGQL